MSPKSNPPLPSRSTLQAAIDRVSANQEAFELIHSSQPHWPYPSPSSSSSPNPHIVIMDSSYNPPHFAHLAMASSSLPPPLSFSSNPTETSPYNARLLLFSVRNIEKVPKEGDASIVQRLEMTILLAHRLSLTNPLEGGVGVGILNEPTFVGKSRILHSYLSNQTETSRQKAKLSFLIGTDTLTRFFEPKFYEKMGGMDKASREYFGDGEKGEGSLLICGRRGEGEENRKIEEEVLGREEVRPWVEMGGVRMLGSGKEGFEEVSSSRIRKAVKEGDKEELENLVPEEIIKYIQEQGLYRS